MKVSNSYAMIPAAFAFTVITSAWTEPSGAEPSSQYLDRLKFEALSNGRTVQLLSRYRYRNGNTVWEVPKGWIIDGATIPRYAYSFVGGPLDGKYRDASVIHDYYCDTNTRPWRDTHRVFYDAMLASGVDAWKAKLMYYAVYTFGPRWDKMRTGKYRQICQSDGSDCRIEQLAGTAPEIYYPTPILELRYSHNSIAHFRFA